MHTFVAIIFAHLQLRRTAAKRSHAFCSALEIEWSYDN